MRHRVLGATVIAFLAFVGAAIQMARVHSNQYERMSVIPELMFPLESDIAALRLLLVKQGGFLQRFVHTGDESSVAAFNHGLTLIADRFENGFAILEQYESQSSVSAPDHLEHVRGLRTQLQALRKECSNCRVLCQTIISKASSGHPVGDEVATLEQRMSSLQGMMVDFVSEVQVLRRRMLSFAQMGMDRVRTAVWIAIVVALLVGVGANIYTYRALLPIRTFTVAVRRIASGSYDTSLPLSGAPELRSLAIDFNHMIGALGRQREELALSKERMLRKEALSQVGELSLGIAHEVRNPLSTIKMTLQALAKHNDLTPADIERLDLSSRELSRLERLVTHLLDFGRPPEPHSASLDIAHCVEDSCNAIAGRFEESSISVEFAKPSSPLLAHADADHVRQVLTNLLSNAAEASAPQGSVRVIAEQGSGARGDTVRIHVLDDGTGIPEGEWNDVFVPFFTRRKGGTGLGLPIARRLAVANGGSLNISSSTSHGTDVVLELPAGQGGLT